MVPLLRRYDRNITAGTQSCSSETLIAFFEEISVESSRADVNSDDFLKPFTGYAIEYLTCTVCGAK